MDAVFGVALFARVPVAFSGAAELAADGLVGAIGPTSLVSPIRNTVSKANILPYKLSSS